MRKEYDLTHSKPGPYAKRISARGREVLIQRFLGVEHLVRLADDVAAAFPDEASVNQALRLVLQLRQLAPAQPKPRRSAKPGARRAA